MSDKPPIIERIEHIEAELAELRKVKQAFLDHWKWHRSEEQHKQEVARHFHERMGIVYATARSRTNAHEGSYGFGPTPDLVDLREKSLADEGYVMIMMEDISGNAPERHIVMEYIKGEWKDVVPPEKLP